MLKIDIVDAAGIQSQPLNIVLSLLQFPSENENVLELHHLLQSLFGSSISHSRAFVRLSLPLKTDPFPSAMGKSRSVTIIVAYLLRQYPHHTVSSALSLVRESRPMAEPNDGFIAQLELYKEMGCPRDIDGHPKYQRWLYQREVDLALAAGMAPERIRFEDEEVQDGTEASGREVELRCRKCRYVPPTFLKSRRTMCTSSILDRPSYRQGIKGGTSVCVNRRANNRGPQAYSSDHPLFGETSSKPPQNPVIAYDRTNIITHRHSAPVSPSHRLYAPLPPSPLLDATSPRARPPGWPSRVSESQMPRSDRTLCMARHEMQLRDMGLSRVQSSKGSSRRDREKGGE
jgi:hypothetical protein